MTYATGNTLSRPTDVSSHTAANQSPNDPPDTYQAPSARAVRRFLERRRARELGYELPLNTREAAAYVGLDRKTVERMARNGEIPVQPASGVRRNTWKFYASELDVWLGEAVLGGTKCLPK
jgi:excisionase family DNA binding protein